MTTETNMAYDVAAPGAARPVLTVDDLHVEFLTDRGWTEVVSGVSYEVHAGETLGLVGESGSGKSVTSLAVMGLIPNPPGRVTGGTALLDGIDLLSLNHRQLEDVRGDDISMIFQEPMTSLNPAFTIGEQIGKVVRRHHRVSRRAAKARSIEVLELVGIPRAAERLRSYPHQFSGGMRQRVMIAMAVACEPKLVIADEPTTALDVTIQAQILDVLKTMQRELGTAVVFITHDLGVVADICDRVAVMYSGQLVETAAIDELFMAPQHPYTEGLMRSMPQVGTSGTRLASIAGSPPEAGLFPDGCRFAARCEYRAPECEAEPVELLATDHPDHQARCRRSHELSLEGAP